MSSSAYSVPPRGLEPRQLPDFQKMTKVSHNRSITLMALGTVVALGSLFLALAAFQVLPTGINAISNLGLGVQIPSLILSGMGISAIIYGAIRYYRESRAEKLMKPFTGVVGSIGEAAQRFNETGDPEQLLNSFINL